MQSYKIRVNKPSSETRRAIRADAAHDQRAERCSVRPLPDPRFVVRRTKRFFFFPPSPPPLTRHNGTVASLCRPQQRQAAATGRGHVHRGQSSVISNQRSSARTPRATETAGRKQKDRRATRPR